MSGRRAPFRAYRHRIQPAGDGSPGEAGPQFRRVTDGSSAHDTTASDIARWMKWHLDRFAATDRDLRLLDHAACLYRDGLTAVSGLDNAGPMDAMVWAG